ncbi:hypothetical protein CGRA01v4_13646 [Colletotrichum graminicola]|uniref:Peroxin 20 n=1 Tax=Colletotrichum graminicola (strain M1.001 / M2 / FGSC 10212) TaxID=645133 RepID=E3QRI0_COLGM|nr:uncharacterized protein GLRG_08747 [Colletotrichum graminicola M1.001]EFQ33468.1 hypothetical protein GLRG_08747 [Colletotrichum graminicola M1.001]WDK22356.1 hypothetical protein CGRA01v4_13646 [Colletotrichum graminicola]
MSDSSCGGSTPFKSLVEHGSHDRSLHQDRFVDAPRVQQGFRSAGSVPPAQAQANFGTFLGSNSTAQIDSVKLSTYVTPITRSFQALQTPKMPDTQHVYRLSPDPNRSSVSRVSSAAGGAAMHTPHRQNYAASSPTATPTWAQDFTRFVGGVSNAGSLPSGSLATQYRPLIPPAFAHNMMPPQAGPSISRPVAGSAVSNMASAEADFDLEMGQWVATHGDGRMEQVDAVMEQIARELAQQEEQQSSTAGHLFSIDLTASMDTATISPPSVSLENTTEHTRTNLVAETINQQANDGQSLFDTRNAAVPSNMNHLEQVPDMSQLNLHEASESAAPRPVEHAQSQTEISEAARQILQSVQHENGDKWKNSQFLLLMKDFRDGNKDIVNNEILETSAGGERIAGN